MPDNNERDEVLFEQLQKNKKRKRRRTVITVVTLVVLALIAIAVAVSVMRTRVRERFERSTADVKTYQAMVGRISTTVSGTGTLAAVGSQQITVPDGVEVEEVLIAAGDTLKEGDAIATVKVASVMTALSDTQKSLETLDKEISEAKNDSVKAYVTATIGGRVKQIFADVDENVVDVMTEHGALAVLSLDGCMSVTIDAALEPRQTITVETEDGKTYPGTVENSNGTTSAITLTDDGPLFGETVKVSDESGALLGTGTLAIHNPVAVTGYAGTIQRVNVKENQKVWAGGSLFTLTNTKYSANYDSLLQTREKTEKTLNELIAMLRTGSVSAPFDGTVLSVDFESEDSSASSATASAASAYLAAAAGASRSASTASGLVTMAPDEQVSVTVGVDETDILSLELGQTAEVTVSSIGDDKLPGVVTEITKVGVSYSGVTQYTAVVTLDKLPAMLTGMTATVDIQIQGKDDVVLIPVDALHQTRNRSYVYTSYNEETKEYGGMVDVVAGVSNSNYVEIISGLKAGDTVYYTEKNVFNFFGMMPGMTGMGNMGSSRNSRTNGTNRTGGNSSRPAGAPGMGG